jgi:hypothetical protein
VSYEADYIVKLGLGDELAMGMTKDAHDGRLTPLDLLMGFQLTRERVYLELYEEYRRAYHRRKKLTYSVGVRVWWKANAPAEQLGLVGLDRPDADLAAGVPSVDEASAKFEYVFSERDRGLWWRALVGSSRRQANLVEMGMRWGREGVEEGMELLSCAVEWLEPPLRAGDAWEPAGAPSLARAA